MYARLGAVPGIGPWTLAEVGRIAFGDPDAISVGDYHLPEPRRLGARRGSHAANDARMLELLEPYGGQRGRVQRLLEASGIQAPRYGPRMAPQRIARDLRHGTGLSGTPGSPNGQDQFPGLRGIPAQ